MTGIRKLLAVAFTAAGLVGGLVAATGPAQAGYYRDHGAYGRSGYHEDYRWRHHAPRHHSRWDNRYEGHWRR